MCILKESLERHAKLNARESELNGVAVYGINQFSDWTPEEFKGMCVFLVYCFNVDKTLTPD